MSRKYPSFCKIRRVIDANKSNITTFEQLAMMLQLSGFDMDNHGMRKLLRYCIAVEVIRQTQMTEPHDYRFAYLPNGDLFKHCIFDLYRIGEWPDLLNSYLEYIDGKGNEDDILTRHFIEKAWECKNPDYRRYNMSQFVFNAIIDHYNQKHPEDKMRYFDKNEQKAE